MKIYLFCASIALFMGAPASLAQCRLAPNSQFKPFSGKLNKPFANFEWYSATSPNPVQGGGHPSHVFERKVTNRASTTLKYTWPVGRMYNDALPPGQTDSYCYEFGWPNQDDGPLNYGRGNDKTATTVWEGKDEPGAQSISSLLTFNVLEEGKVRQVTLLVESSTRPTPEGVLAYGYLFRNLSERPIRLEWRVQEDKPLLGELRKRNLTQALSIETAREFSFESRYGSFTRFRGIDILWNGRPVAGAVVPILVPKMSF